MNKPRYQFNICVVEEIFKRVMKLREKGCSIIEIFIAGVETKEKESKD